MDLSSYRYRGRHRAPSIAGRTTTQIVTASAAITAPLTLPLVVPAAALAAPPGGWDAIIECESSNRNVENPDSSASGYFQFIDGTWRLYGGTEFAPRAIGATKTEQTIVADRAHAANGLKDWEASRACWGGKVGRHAANTEAPRHAAPTAPKHARTHTVRRGDTLGKIAAAHHTTVRKLIAANPCVVDNPDLIFPGEQFNV